LRGLLSGLLSDLLLPLSALALESYVHQLAAMAAPVGYDRLASKTSTWFGELFGMVHPPLVEHTCLFAGMSGYSKMIWNLCSPLLLLTVLMLLYAPRLIYGIRYARGGAPTSTSTSTSAATTSSESVHGLTQRLLDGHEGSDDGDSDNGDDADDDCADDDADDGADDVDAVDADNDVDADDDAVGDADADNDADADADTDADTDNNDDGADADTDDIVDANKSRNSDRDSACDSDDGGACNAWHIQDKLANDGGSGSSSFTTAAFAEEKRSIVRAVACLLLFSFSAFTDSTLRLLYFVDVPTGDKQQLERVLFYDGSTRTGGWQVSIFFLLAIIIAAPLLPVSLWLLCQLPSTWPLGRWARQHTRMGKVEVLQALRRYALEPYVEKCWHWTPLLTLQRVFTVMCISLAQQRSEAALGVAVLSLWFLLFQVTARPFKLDSVNTMQSVCCVSLVLISVLGLPSTILSDVGFVIDGTPFDALDTSLDAMMLVLLLLPVLFVLCAFVFGGKLSQVISDFTERLKERKQARAAHRERMLSEQGRESAQQARRLHQLMEQFIANANATAAEVEDGVSDAHLKHSLLGAGPL
jgi:hypothetical protein